METGLSVSAVALVLAACSGGDESLSPEDISALLFEESEFPVDFERFESFADTGEGVAESPDIPADLGLGSGAAGTRTGTWTSAEEQALGVNMIHVTIADYEDTPADADSAELDFSDSDPEEMGGLEPDELDDYEIDFDSENFSHNGWEGTTFRATIEMGGTTIENESSTLTRTEGSTMLVVSTTGKGQQYLEEVADLQWAKYEAGR